MSLATQLTRGTLALPMLLAFAALGIFANERVAAESVGATAPAELQIHADVLRLEQLGQFQQAGQVAALERLAAAQARAAAAAGLPALGQRLCAMRGTRSHVLVLAQAPADLGNLALRMNTACRA